MRRLLVCCATAMALSCSLLAAQDSACGAESIIAASTVAVEDTNIDENGASTPLTPRHKLILAARDSLDWPECFITGAFAFLDHKANKHPGFGRGLRGYAKRYAGLFGDQAISTVAAEGLLPVLFREDPRYFRAGEGRTLARLGIALRHTVVRRESSGKWRLNKSEILGASAAVGISNFYYRDSRTPSANLQRFGIQIGSDALSNVLKEFWPDIKHRLFDGAHSERNYSKTR